MSPDNLKDRLNRFGPLVAPGTKDATRNCLPARYHNLAGAVGGRIVTRSAGTYCLVTRLYSHGYFHGRIRLSDPVLDSVPRSAFSALDERGELRVDKMLFIDTETTGLGGAGAVPFVVGCGKLTEGGFEVRQYLLPDYTDEAGMLEDLLMEFTPDTILVSYNGAAFDLPILNDRIIINRVGRKVEHACHVDLLHPVRRLFKRRLRDCTLINIEESLFGFKRSGDIPGYLIPSVYFEWLAGEDTTGMPEVLEHNRLDIVSLLCLVYHIALIYASRGHVLSEVDDLHSLSRVFGRRRNTLLVSEVFSQIDRINEADLAEDILLYHSLNFKRTGDIDRAVRMWQELSRSDSREGYWANLELAKYFEHRQKDLSLALRHTRLAEKICPYGQSHRRQLSRRLDRLKAKLRD
jgi:uncharacterized protein YprB with RNaseH-like and TPR domain